MSMSRASRAGACCRAARRRTTRRSRRAAMSSRRSSQAKPTDRVAQEEVFGPFVTVSTFSSDEEALAIANGTEYGLGAGLWTRDLQRAHLVARQLRERHGVDQLLQARESRLAVRRCRRERLWPRDGLRSDARIHAAEVGLGQRRRATFRLTIRAEAMEPFIYQGMPSRVVFGAGSIEHLEREIELLGAQARARALDAAAARTGRGARRTPRSRASRACSRRR